MGCFILHAWEAAFLPPARCSPLSRASVLDFRGRRAVRRGARNWIGRDAVLGQVAG
jgi:hypothetical protein